MPTLSDVASRDNDENELDLRQYLRVLRRRKGVIALSVAVTMGIAIGASLLQTPVYQGRAEVLLQAPSTETLFDPTSGQRTDPTRAVQTEIQVLKSRPVRDAVKRKLNFVSNVSAAPVGQTDVIRVSASSSSPRRAADVANAYATSYIDFRRTQSVDDLLAASQEVQKKINDIDGQIAALDSGGSASSGVKASPQGTAERDSLISQEAVFKQKLDQLQVDAALKTGGAQLVTPAIIPTSPIAPRPIRSAVVALALGLGVGLQVVAGCRMTQF